MKKGNKGENGGKPKIAKNLKYFRLYELFYMRLSYE
jgi:hypothetical protein